MILDERLARLGLRWPIFQAPMAGISTPAMVAAVSEAGGLGALGLGATDAAGATQMMADVRARTQRAFNVNLFCHAPAQAKPAIESAWIARLGPEFARLDATPPVALREIYRSFVADDDMLRALMVARPRVISFHFGLPSTDKLAALRERGAWLVGSATSLVEAQTLARAGLDAVVAQGWEAGGHRGVFDPDAPDDRLGTVALVRVLVRALSIPIIAAGGIMDGAGVAASLRLGAVAAQLGTAFVPTDESAADAGYRQSLAGDAAHHTVMTRAISGRPARCLANRFTAIAPHDAEVPSYPIAYDAGKALHAAGKAKGEFGWGAQWAGQAAPLARAMPTAKLMQTLVDELERASR